MDQFSVESVVWASARGDIFWPGQVVERTMMDASISPKEIWTIHFFVEDSYEDIKNKNKIYRWNCEKQEKFIAKGRGLKNELRKVQFNKAVIEAEKLSMQQEKRLKGNNLRAKRKSAGGETAAFIPRKSPRRHMGNGCSSEHLATCANNLTESQMSDIKDNTPTKRGCTVSTCRLKNKNSKVDCSLEQDSTRVQQQGSQKKSSLGESMTLHVILEEECASPRKSSQCKSKQSGPDKTCQNKLGLTLTGERAKQKKFSEDESKISSSQRKSTQYDESKTLMSEEKLGRLRRSSQDRSNTCTLTSTVKQGEALKCLSTRNGHVTTPQKKRKLSVDTEPKQKRTSTKKGKSCDQNDLKQETRNTGDRLESNKLPSTNNKLLTNGHKNDVEITESEISSDTGRASAENMPNVSADCSVSSDTASSDDELMTEAFSPSQESSQFSVNDIVWAKYFTEPYWPAVIKRLVTGKRKRDNKILVQFLGWNKTLFKIQQKKLVHFACDQSKKDEFLEIKDKLKYKELQENFEQALKEAEDLLNRKGLGRSLDEMDEDDDEVFEEEDDVEDDVEIIKESKEDVSEKSIPFESRKSSRTKKQVSQYGNILSYIRQAKPFLKQILTGTKSSERHLTYTSGRVSEKDNLKHRAGFGPIADENLRDDIMDLLLQFYEELKKSRDVTYVSEVWLPEALIWSIQQIQHVDRQKAEKMYLEGSKFAVTNEEVQQLTAKLKQKKLSQADATERLQKVERAIARWSAP